MCAEVGKIEPDLAGLERKFAGDDERMLELGLVRAFLCHLEAARDVFEFYYQRREAVVSSRSGDKDTALRALSRMKAIAAREKGVTDTMRRLCERDSRLGFHSEAEAHQFFPAYLEWRLGELARAGRELDGIVAELSAGRPYPESPCERRPLEIAAHERPDGSIDIEGECPELAEGQEMELRTYDLCGKGGIYGSSPADSSGGTSDTSCKLTLDGVTVTNAADIAAASARNVSGNKLTLTNGTRVWTKTANYFMSPTYYTTAASAVVSGGSQLIITDGSFIPFRNYLTKASLLVTGAGSIISNATQSSGALDYLFYQSLVSELPIPVTSEHKLLSNGKLGMKATFTLAYRTTAEQEKQVDAAVAELLDSLELEGKSDYDKVKAIYDWMNANIEYDFDGLARYLTKHIASSAYAALFDHTAVCQGYSVLFYRLCLEEGIDARVVQDVTGGGAPHVWNIVQMDNGCYYYVDTTLGAGLSQKFDLPSDGFFLKGSDYWSKLPLYTLGDQYTNKLIYPDFAKEHPICAEDYDGTAGHTHDMKHIEAKSPSLFAKGNIEYWQCSICGKCFSDPYGSNIISSADTVLDKTGFSFSFITDFFARIMETLRSFLPC